MTCTDFGLRLLQVGCAGTDVSILQWHLNKLSGPIMASVAVNGNFDNKTAEAVKLFQKFFYLTPDGVADKNTFLLLGQITGSYLPSKAKPFGSRILKKGSTGFDVWVMQNRLASTRKKYALALGGPADSVFGAQTQATVKLFQKDHALPVNGIADQDTIYSLFLHTFMGGRLLQRGRWDQNRGYDVYWLQVHLKEQGFYTEKLDGYFGPLTEKAVKELQKLCGIRLDGIVGPETYYHLATI
ncbi:MAG: peptidoglycan-binding protein [Syntrophomonadaceae bacterium]